LMGGSASTSSAGVTGSSVFGTIPTSPEQIRARQNALPLATPPATTRGA
jgi:hypothetical protein